MNNSDTRVYDKPQVLQWINHMVDTLEALIDNTHPVALIGIRRGGVDVCQLLHQELIKRGVELDKDMGELNIAFYRDDFSSMGLHPVVGPSQVPFNIDKCHVVLVDDVLGTGRTVRAAMNEIFDYGRPARITLAVLVQRVFHELPIRADVVGHELDVANDEYIDLDPENMKIKIGVKS